MEQLLEWSEGNPGAMAFLMEVFFNPEIDPVQAIIVKGALDRCKTLRGTNIYVMHSDLCDKDMDKVIHLLRHCPDNVIEDACSRQDYSGRELIAKYMIMA